LAQPGGPQNRGGTINVGIPRTSPRQLHPSVFPGAPYLPHRSGSSGAQRPGIQTM
jgi:hypothetical protein